MQKQGKCLVGNVKNNDPSLIEPLSQRLEHPGNAG
jgi:hypothetical protein